MNVPRISFELSAEQHDAIMQNLRGLDTQLDFAINLTPEDRRRIRKLSVAKRSFARDAHAFCIEKSETVPSMIDMTEFSKDLSLSNHLYKMSNLLKVISEKLHDTAAASGWQAYRRAMQYLIYIRELAKTEMPGCEAIAAELSKYFKFKKKSTKQDDNNSLTDNNSTDNTTNNITNNNTSINTTPNDSTASDITAEQNQS